MLKRLLSILRKRRSGWLSRSIGGGGRRRARREELGLQISKRVEEEKIRYPSVKT